MTDTHPFAELLLLLALVGLAAVLSNRLSGWLRIPAPALFLAAAAVAEACIPSLHEPPHRSVERIVTVALLLILFDGGMGIGVRRLRTSAGPILLMGVAGTVLTTAAVAVVAHLGFGFSWYVAALLGTALAPTDPAVVFSVLGQREIAGRSSTILEGESGANDPVGIALLASLLSAGTLSGGAVAHVLGEFTLQMGVGGALGVGAGLLTLTFMRRVSLPSEGLYPLRTLACVFSIYAVTTLAHGSGFLAVFIAGIVVGDERAPFKREIERFHSALASLGEIVAFIALGLTVDLGTLSHRNVWLPGVIIAVVLTVAIRPVLVGVCLLPARLRRNEMAFVLLAGLKGAVPILLGSLVLASRVPGAARVYGIVVVVVTLSVVVQGGLLPSMAGWLRLPVRDVDPQPWALGVRLQDEPTGVLHLSVARGAPADGATLTQVASLATAGGDSEDVWFNMVVRDHQLITIRGSTVLEPGDQVLATADQSWHPPLITVFTQPRRP